MNLNWSHVQDDVKKLIEDSAPARHLLKSIKLLSMTDQQTFFSIQISVENKLVIQMCQRLLLPQLKNVLESRLGLPVAFDFTLSSLQESFEFSESELLPTDQSTTQTAVQQIAAPLPPRFQFKSKYSLNPRYQFTTFCITEENKFAKFSAEHFVSNGDAGPKVMLFTGPSGTGKTHLLNSVGWNFLSLQKNLKVKMISGDDLITDFQTAIFRRTMTEFRLKYRLETDVLLIDDIHCLERAKATQTELFNLINEFQNAGKKIILTCDRPIEKIENLDERLRSRLLGSLQVELQHPSLASKQIILNYKLAEASLDVQPAFIEKILVNTGPCIRSLEGAIHRIQMLLQTSGQLDSAVLDKMFPSIANPDGQSIGVDTVLLKICSSYQITLKDLKGPSRRRQLVVARRECAHALKVNLGKTTADIGRILQRDHSTVISLLKSAAKLSPK